MHGTLTASWKEEQRQSRLGCLDWGQGNRMKTAGGRRLAAVRRSKHSLGHAEWAPGDIWVGMPRAVQQLRRGWREKAGLS